MKSKYVLFFVLLLIVVQSGWSQSAGTTGFEFLRSQYSPRGAAIGGNLLAIKGDIHSVLYNPAALSGNTRRQWSVNYIDHLLDFQGGNLAYAQPFMNLGNLSANLVYFNYGTFDETDEFGDRTGQTFGASEFALGVGLSNSLGGGFDYGLGVKFVYSSIERFSASAVAVDAGIIYTMASLDNLKLGVSLLNLGATLSNYTDQKEKLPLLLRVGFSKRLAHLPLLFTGSLNDLTTSEERVTDRLKKFALGGEFDLTNVVKLRLGYQNEIHSSIKPLGRTVFGGVSLGLGVFWRSFRLDYSYSNFGDLGSQNRIGISGSL